MNSYAYTITYLTHNYPQTYHSGILAMPSLADAIAEVMKHFNYPDPHSTPYRLLTSLTIMEVSA